MSNTHQPRTKRALSAAASIVLGALALFALLLVVLGVVARPGHDGISRVGGHPMLTVLSGSMTPVFRPGDLVMDNAVPADKADQLAVGNIITFRVSNSSSTNLITHKIVAIKQQDGGIAYQTKGVANNAPDPELVQPSQIVGTYRSHIPLAGYLLQAVQKKTIFFLLILVPLLYLGLSEIAKRWRPEPSEVKKGNAEDEPHSPADVTAVELPLAEPAAQTVAPAEMSFTAQPHEESDGPAAMTDPVGFDQARDQLVAAAVALTYQDALSALRRDDSKHQLSEAPANYVTGEGGDASV